MSCAACCLRILSLILVCTSFAFMENHVFINYVYVRTGGETGSIQDVLDVVQDWRLSIPTTVYPR